MLRRFHSLLTGALSAEAEPSPDGRPRTGGDERTRPEQEAVIQRMLEDEDVSSTEAMLMTQLDRDELIVRIVRHEGGRVEQKQLVEWTDWSASTVSRSLSAMEADGRIERVQVGRKNLVLLPDSRSDAET